MALTDFTGSLEQFRLAVVAEDPQLLEAFKALIAKQMESETKAYEFQLRDMDRAEAQRIVDMETKDKKRQRPFTDMGM